MEKNFISVNVSCEDKAMQSRILSRLNKAITAVLLSDIAIPESSVRCEGWDSLHSLIFTFDSK